MKRTKNTILVGIFLCISLSFTGCEEKPSETTTTLPIENSTEIVGGQDKNISQSNRPVTQKETITSFEEKAQTTQKPISSDRLIFEKSDGTKYTLMVQGDKLIPDPKSKPILLINLFDINERDSIAQIPYLTRLQNEYGNRLTILGVPMNQSLDEEELKTFISMHQIDYFISYDSNRETLSNIFSKLLDIEGLTTPTTLLYHKGETDSIYEGAVPIEMITHDILMINKK